MEYILVYEKLLQGDKDIPELLAVYRMSEIAEYFSIDFRNYFTYVTQTENVFYYKVLKDEKIIGSVHAEIWDNVLHIGLRYTRGISINAMDADSEGYRQKIKFNCSFHL